MKNIKVIVTNERSKSFVLLALSFVLFTTFSCSKKSNDNSKQCNFDTGSITATKNGQVVYKVTATGSGTVTSLTYSGNGGNITVANPTIPYSIVVPVNTGTTIRLAVTAVTTVGQVEAEYDFTDTNGTLSSAKQECGN